MKQIISTNAPKAAGPYSQAIEHNGLVEVSGQIGIDPEKGSLVSGGIEAETNQTLLNIKAILIEAGLAMNNIVKARVYLTNMEDYAIMNQVYADHFVDIPPARIAIAVRALPLEARIEIECTALI